MTTPEMLEWARQQVARIAATVDARHAPRRLNLRGSGLGAAASQSRSERDAGAGSRTN